MEKITIGMAGAGRAFELHMQALKYVSGISLRYRTVMGRRREQVEAAKQKYGFEKAVYDYNDLIDDPEIDVIHIVTPPYCHEEMIKKALQAEKNVICEKPFIGYFGNKNNTEEVGFFSKKYMYQEVLRKLEEIQIIARKSKKRLMYADNAVYAPGIIRISEFITAKKSKILFMKGEESLKGSSSLSAGEWSKAGGGTFCRNAAHPLTAMLWLKRQEAKARGERITLESIVADMEMISPLLTEYEHRHIDARPVDTEDIGAAILKFSDNSRAVIMATNIYLGGLRDYVEVYCNDATYNCKLTLSDVMSTYFLDEDGIKDMKLSELLTSKVGWNNAFVSDEVLRGYVGEMQNFMESIYYSKEPLSGLDLAVDATRVIYAAYLSAEQKSVVAFEKGESL